MESNPDHPRSDFFTFFFLTSNSGLLLSGHQRSASSLFRPRCSTVKGSSAGFFRARSNERGGVLSTAAIYSPGSAPRKYARPSKAWHTEATFRFHSLSPRASYARFQASNALRCCVAANRKSSVALALNLVLHQQVFRPVGFGRLRLAPGRGEYQFGSVRRR